MMSVYPSCMQRPGIPGVGFPLSLPWSFPAAQLPPLSQQSQNALTLQVQIPSFPRPSIASVCQLRDSMEQQKQQQQQQHQQKSAPSKQKPSPSTKSTPTSFTIASILSKSDDRDKPARNSPVVAQALNVTGHASAAGSISPSTPLSAGPKTPLYYLSPYHPAAQASPFSFTTAQSPLDHDLQRSPLSRMGAPAPLTLGDCMVRRYGKKT